MKLHALALSGLVPSITNAAHTSCEQAAIKISCNMIRLTGVSIGGWLLFTGFVVGIYVIAQCFKPTDKKGRITW